MFEAIVRMKSICREDSFLQAFKEFWKGVLELGNIYPRTLDTCWIQWYPGGRNKNPINIDFYTARDFAIEIGLLEEQKLQESVEEPSQEQIWNLFFDLE